MGWVKMQRGAIPPVGARWRTIFRRAARIARHTHRAQHVGFVAVDLHQEVDERAPRNEEVERVPAGLEVLATAVRHQLNEHLDRKAGGEEVVGHLDDVRELLRLALMDEAHGHRVAHDHYVDEPLPLG